MKYGSATLNGYYVKDTVCIAKEADLCVKDFKFFEITYDKGLDWDGILGMSPIAPKKNKGDSLIKQLKD